MNAAAKLLASASATPSDLRVPRALDEITPAWMTGALREAGYGGAIVSGVSAEPLGRQVGFICTLSKIHLTYVHQPHGAPATVIAKMASTEEFVRALASSERLWARESDFYRHIAPNVPNTLARCYYNGSECEEDLYTLLLEDLSGGEPGDQIVGATEDQARTAINWLAVFHASWWGREPEAVDMMREQDQYRRAQPMICGVLPRYLEVFGDAMPDQARTLLERSVEQMAVADAFQTCAGPRTVLHGDFRLDNMIFDDAGQLAVVDWQTMQWGDPAYDLAWFLTYSLPTDLRRAMEHELVAQYRTELQAHGVSAPSVEDLFSAYRRKIPAVMAVSALGGGIASEDDERAMALFRSIASRVSIAAVDLAVGDFLK